MAEVYLTWNEAQSGSLPAVCISCGRPASELVARRVASAKPGLLTVVHRRADITIPVCPEHRQASWVYWRRVVLKDFDDGGIRLDHVADEFIAALASQRQLGYQPPPQGHANPPPLPLVARPKRSGWLWMLVILATVMCGLTLLVFIAVVALLFFWRRVFP